MADCVSPLIPLVREVKEEVLISLEVDSFSLFKVRALESIKLCCRISFSIAFVQLSDSSGSELSDDIAVFTILPAPSLDAAMKGREVIIRRGY